MNSSSRPPRLARTLVTSLLRGEMREIVLGDLDEEFTRSLERGAALSHAKRRYWRQALASVIRRPSGEPRRRFPRATTAGLRGAFVVDWRDARRALRAAPAVAAFSIAALGLGIGGVTALFSILNSLALKPLPVAHPEQLVLLDDGEWTYPIWSQIRDHHRDIAAGVCAWGTSTFNLSEAGEADNVRGLYVSGDFFAVMGVTIPIGRGLRYDDDVRGGSPAGPVAVISDGFWRSRFASDRSVIGRTLTIERVPFTIVGVGPRGFLGPDVGSGFDIAVPIETEPLVRRSASFVGQGAWWLNIIARLQPGQSVLDATTRLRALQAGIRVATMPRDLAAADRSTYLTTPMTLVSGAGGNSPLRGRYQEGLTLLLVAALMVMLIACANMAGLLIARVASRQREIAVRLAIGASRFRLARQLLAEAFLLASAGAIVGLVIAYGASRAIVSRLTTFALRVDLNLSVDWRVLGFCVLVAAATAFVAGIVPALSIRGIGAAEALSHRIVDTLGGPSRTRRVVMTVQIGMSFALLVAAGLFVATLDRLVGRDPGFDTNRVLLVSADASRTSARGPDRFRLFDRLATAADRVPGVVSTAASVVTPVSGHASKALMDAADSQVPAPLRKVWVNAISPDWFTTLGSPLVEGRDFRASDSAQAPRVAIVNRAFERRFFKNSAVGQPVPWTERAGSNPAARVIVGVVGDAVYLSLRSPMEPTIFVPLLQLPDMNPVVFSIRVTDRPESSARSVMAAMRQEAPDVILSSETLREQLDASLSQERLLAAVGGGFGVLALVLAAVGLYGLSSFAVTSSLADIAIRVALGASRASVLGLVFGRIMGVVAAGLGVGLILAIWGAPSAASLLYGLRPREPFIFGLAAVILAGVAGLAAWAPAYRASRVDPMTILRT